MGNDYEYNYEYNSNESGQFLDEYWQIQLSRDGEHDSAATINPALLQSTVPQQSPSSVDPLLFQTSIPAPDLCPLPQQDQVALESRHWQDQLLGGEPGPSAHSLRRHIQNAGNVAPNYLCPECKGRKSFKRKDNLEQHLERVHGLYQPHHQTRRLAIAACHFESCEYYRGPDFAQLPNKRQRENRPFERRPEYNMHMRQEHDWSPYPCNILGCDRINGSGFFTAAHLERHCKDKHQGSEVPALAVRDEAEITVACDYCNGNFKSSALASHQRRSCRGITECRHCHRPMESKEVRDHEMWYCEAKVTCRHCHETVESRELSDHQKYDCKKTAAGHR
ncbi:hypothetical protein GGR51DRAFT_556106 [Nemania sp. FL0031]|nr:hypothetical protein GGR51DRAFT_556106 [Nemania sp. FL0031]